MTEHGPETGFEVGEKKKSYMVGKIKQKGFTIDKKKTGQHQMSN